MLKRKIEVNYRRANERFKRCKYCTHKKWTSIHTCGPVDASSAERIPRHDWRCDIIGLQNPRKYGIQDDHVCDHHAPNTETRGGKNA